MSWKQNKAEKAYDPDYLRNRCDALYLWNKDSLYRMALKALNGDRELAQEVTERTFINAFRHIDKLDNEQSDRTKAFLVSQLKSVLSGVYQKARDRVGIPGEFNKVHISKQDEFNVDQVLIRNEMLSKLANYVDALTEREKEFLFFRYFMGFTPKEVGLQFGISEESAKNCIFQVKQRVATMILEKKR